MTFSPGVIAFLFFFLDFGSIVLSSTNIDGEVIHHPAHNNTTCRVCLCVFVMVPDIVTRTLSPSRTSICWKRLLLIRG